MIDRWKLNFIGGGILLILLKLFIFLNEDCVVLFFGGVDSFIGVIDLVVEGKKLYVVS